MDGLMMDRPLLVKQIAERAEAGVRRTARSSRGPRTGSSAPPTGRWSSGRGGWPARCTELGVRPGDRVASFAWNSLRHLELYLAVPSMGAVLHTLNIRLFEDDLRYVVEHADDRLVFLDASLAESMPRFDGVEHEVLMPDGPRRAPRGARLRGAGGGRRSRGSSSRLRREHGGGHVLHERHHRAAEGRAVLAPLDRPPHARARRLPDSMGIREADSVMPVVPMFHAMAWGIPYVATMVGARQVLPGPDLSPGRARRPDRRRGGSPGAPACRRSGTALLELEPPPDLSSLRELKAGGAAVPESLIRAFDERFGVPRGAGMGDDRDQSAGRASSRLPAGVDLAEDEALRAAGHPGPRPAAGRLPHRRRRRRRASGPRAVDRARLLRGPRAATRSSPRTAGCAPGDVAEVEPATRSSSWSTAPRTWSSRGASGSRRWSWRTRSWPTPTWSRPP